MASTNGVRDSLWVCAARLARDIALVTPAGEQVAHGGGDDVRLAQRGEHLVDVVQEDPGWPHHEDAGALQALAVRVEQVGSPVERDGGLASPRPALDHQDPLDVVADDRVLLGLDRGDDVPHASLALSLIHISEPTRLGMISYAVF